VIPTQVPLHRILAQSHKATKIMNENEIGKIVVDCAVNLHKELGPGLFETVYEVLLAHELESQGLKVDRQVSIPIKLNGVQFDEGFRADIIERSYIPIAQWIYH
jgi:hypothetical protein